MEKVLSEWVDTFIWVKSCPWTKFPPKVGGFCYETNAFAPFRMGHQFSKNFQDLLNELTPISTFENQKVAEVSYNFLKDFYSESAVHNRKRKNRFTFSAKSDLKAAIRHAIRTYYHPKWDGEEDVDKLDRIERNRVVRSVKCDKDGGNQSRATSYHVKSILQLCRDLKVSRTAFDYEMRKFRERYNKA